MQDSFFQDKAVQFRIIDLGTRFTVCPVWFDDNGKVTGFEDKAVRLETEKSETYELIIKQIKRANELPILDIKELRKELYVSSDAGISYQLLLDKCKELSEEKSTIKVDLSEIAEAMFMCGPDMDIDNYLDKTTGERVRVCGGEASSYDFDLEDYDRYISIEGPSPSTGWQFMEDFVNLLVPSQFKQKLEKTIHGHKPFRSFKDRLYEDKEIQDKWFTYERFRQVEYALNELADQELAVQFTMPEYYNKPLEF